MAYVEQLAFIPNLGPMELVIILLIVLLLFGGRKFPELARGLGKGVHEFKKGLKDVENEIIKEDSREDDKPDATEEREGKKQDAST